MKIELLLVMMFSILGSLNLKAQQQPNKLIENELKLFKDGSGNREVKYSKKIFEDLSNKKMNSNSSKDSIRHCLEENGFYDYNFEYLQVQCENIKDLKADKFKVKNKKFSQILIDSSFNNVSYYYEETGNGISIEALFSKNYVEIDSIKEAAAVLGIGYKYEELTYRGKSKIDNIFFTQDSSYLNITKLSNENKKPLRQDKDGKFEMTFDVTNHKRKYVAIKDESGNILSLLKVY